MEAPPEDVTSLREWLPLTTLLSQIPRKAQRGLFTSDLYLTCIASLPDFLAIGTNHGLVYWYNRATHELQRLRCASTLCGITCIRTVSSVDYMIAAGADNGTVTIFMVPKKLPENVPDIFKAHSKKQVERYTVAGLHTAPVSAVEWSTNGMKLFSGDQKGLLVVTEIDFYMHLSKSVEVLNEKYEIVQLSYNPSHQLLLVSTLYRTILCHRSDADNTWKVTQVGNKERKMLGRMGATFSYSVGNPRSPVAYCSRPGLRLWLSNKEGVVEKTLIYKDAVLREHKHIQLLNPSRSGARFHRSEPVLGTLISFMERYLVTYSPDSLLILDPETISVVAALYDVEKISALCVSKSEIFILEGGRHLIRLGLTPENISASSPQDASRGIPIASHLLGLTAKLKDASIVSAIPIKTLSPLFSPTRSSGSSDSEHVSECVEAQELPPVVPLDSLGPQTAQTVPQLMLSDAFSTLDKDKEIYSKAQCSKEEISVTSGALNPKLLEKINQEKYEEVVFQVKRKHNKSKNKKNPTGSGSDTNSIWSSTSETDDIWTSERLDVSSDWSIRTAPSSTSSRRPSNDESQSKLNDNLSSVCGPSSSGWNGTAGFEKLHSTLLEGVISCLETAPSSQDRPRPSTLPLPLPLDLEHCSSDAILEESDNKETSFSKKHNPLMLSCDQKSSNVKNLDEGCSFEDDESILHSNDEQLGITSEECDDAIAQRNCSVDEFKTITNEESAQVPFQDNNTVSLGGILGYRQPSNSTELQYPEDWGNQGHNKDCQDVINVMVASGWLKYYAPQPISWLSVSSLYAVAIDAHDVVHYCNLADQDLKWQQADYKAKQISLSPNADHIWQIRENKAYALRNPSLEGIHGKDWTCVGDNFRSIAVGIDVAWAVSQEGEVLCFKDLTQENPVTSAIPLERPCEWPALKVAYFSQVVWILSTTGEVYVRVGISSVKPEGTSWKRVNIPVPGSILDIALGAQRTGWIIDNNDTIMFSVDHMEPEPHWWQVLIFDSALQTPSVYQTESKIAVNEQSSHLPSHTPPSSFVASSTDSLWLAQQSSCIFYRNKTSITGDCWNRVRLKGRNTNLRWQTITAEGVFENSGQLWLLSVHGNLFCLSPRCDQKFKTDSLQEVPLPSDRGAVCLAAAPQALWLLTSTGEIYIRQGLSDSCLQGNDWRELSLAQIDGIHLAHISCGCDTVWACDTAGNMYMAISSPYDMATSTFSPAWIHVGDANKEQNKIFFIKVFVGSQTSMVWALDSKGTIYVREAIFPDFQLGLDWVAVTGITAVDLSTSNSAVWALSMDGAVYQRHGITQTNYIGDYWKKIPGSVEALTASICDSLWGIDKNGYLLRHASLTVHLSSNSGTHMVVKHPNSAPIDDDDWEVVS